MRSGSILGIAVEPEGLSLVPEDVIGRFLVTKGRLQSGRFEPATGFSRRVA